ncbi:hypothetical protein [Micromonospora sp. IBHARD004]|uniref:hypothetical protein n=1 Tax=Micromonospora sp. IBHARD004 TaxID=3457764 RepID=UPI00405808C0
MSWDNIHNVSKDPDRVEQRFDVPMPLNPGMPLVGDLRGVNFDRVGVDQAHTPSKLVAGDGERGVETEWDAGSLDSAVTWLETHASYVHRLSYDMSTIKDELAPNEWAEPGQGALGGFPNAQELTKNHDALFSSTQQGLRTLSDGLWAAAEALREVKRKYEDAEHANAMSAQEMQQAFNDAASGGNG